MTRDEAAGYVAERFGAYLAAAGRAATDTTAGLKGALDDSLRALGYAAADIPIAAPSDAEAEEDWRVQAQYRAMAQIVRDLGATQFDISSEGDALKLSQIRAAAEKDLAAAQALVLERFGTLGTVILAADGGIVALDLDFLQPTAAEWTERYA